MEAPHLERKLVAIFAADVEGFSRHMEHNEGATLEVLSAHRVIIDGSIQGHGGRITGTAGDSVLAEFSSVLAAVECAVEIQNRLADENAKLDPERALLLRIGINVGDVMVKEGDIFGDGVNIAARLELLAEPGGICVSRGVRDHLRKHRTVVFEDLGEQKVKNIAHPIRAFKIRLGEVPSEEASPLPENDEDLGSSVLSSEIDSTEVELAFWNSIKDSQNPEEFEIYLQRYPDGAFATLAETRREALRGPARHSQTSPGKEEGLAVELAFWEAAKDSENEAELEAYLERYPEGEFVPLAKARLAALREAAGRKGEPVEVELTFWSSIKDSTDLEMFRAYLDRYPDGRFSELARIQIASKAG